MLLSEDHGSEENITLPAQVLGARLDDDICHRSQSHRGDIIRERDEQKKDATTGFCTGAVIERSEVDGREEGVVDHDEALRVDLFGPTNEFVEIGYEAVGVGRRLEIQHPHVRLKKHEARSTKHERGSF